MRPGRRPKAPSPKPAKAPDPTEAEVMARLLMSATPERQQQLIDAIWDRACGQRVWMGDYSRKPGGKELGVHERRVRMTDLDTGEEIEGWVYEVPGAADSQKLLVEHGIGRPAVRETAKQDPVIQLIHRVPGKRDWKTQQQQVMVDVGPGEAGTATLSPDVPGVLTIGGQEFGAAALFPPEPEDDPGVEE